MVAPEIIRFQIWLVELSPTKGREINKTRPCIVISPKTTKGFEFPCRVECTFEGKKGLILLDQIRAVDKLRLVKSLGILDEETQMELCQCLQELFAY